MHRQTLGEVIRAPSVANSIHRVFTYLVIEFIRRHCYGANESVMLFSVVLIV